MFSCIISAILLNYVCLFLANSLIPIPYLQLVQATNHDNDPRTSHITILGSVYCDVCYLNTFSKHSYFLPGVDVHIQCKLKARSASTIEQISFSVNRTTNRYGVYKIDISSVDYCTNPTTVHSFCQASLIRPSPVSACNVTSAKTTSTEITLKSKQGDNACTYTFGALTYKPPPPPSTRNVTSSSLCGGIDQNYSWINTSKFFLPPLPPLPQFPPLPQLPPLPPFPSFPFPSPPDSSISPPVFNPWDPRTWIPNNPFLSPPPPPPLSPPVSPPVFNFWDPRTWIPFFPPSPPTYNNPSTQSP